MNLPLNRPNSPIVGIQGATGPSMPNKKTVSPITSLGPLAVDVGGSTELLGFPPAHHVPEVSVFQASLPR